MPDQKDAPGSNLEGFQLALVLIFFIVGVVNNPQFGVFNMILTIHREEVVFQVVGAVKWVPFIENLVYVFCLKRTLPAPTLKVW